MIFGVVIPADTNAGVILVMLEGRLLEMQTIVGGFIEILPTDAGDLIVNEEGLLKNLPLNPIATCLRSGIEAARRDNLRGTALLLGNVDEEGEFTDVAPDGLAEVKEAMRQIEELKAKVKRDLLGGEELLDG